ncbi:putative acetyltransferase domain protein [Mycobacterium xenopi 3993]|nr:putative acetyltransferase domain protein [Mycobacterium xenopi 3993]
MALLGVTLTATSFTWREHVTVQRADGKELSGLSARDYPGARALVQHVRVPKLRMRPPSWKPRTICRCPPKTAASATGPTRR